MAQMITWDTCLYTLSTHHFDTTYVSIWLVIAAMICFFLYYLISTLYDTGKIKWLTEHKAQQLCKNLILIGCLLLVAFIIYYMFFFRPDAVQAQVNDIQAAMAGRKDVMEILV